MLTVTNVNFSFLFVNNWHCFVTLVLKFFSFIADVEGISYEISLHKNFFLPYNLYFFKSESEM